MTTNDRSSDKSNSSDHGVSRRKYLSGLVTTGVAGVGFSQIGSARRSDSVVIPEIVRDGEAKTTTEVPRDWYEHIQHARDVVSRVRKSVQDQPWYEYSGRAADDQLVSGLRRDKIKVYVSDITAAKSALPDHVEGIPVEIAEAKERHIDNHWADSEECDHYTSESYCIEGGEYIREKRDDGTCFSVTCIAESGGDYYLMTSGHGFMDTSDCPENTSGEMAEQNYGLDVGDVYTYNHDYDVSLVDPYDINGVDNTLVNESQEVLGAISKSKIDELKSTNETIHQVGTTTKETQGQVLDIIQDYAPRCDRTKVDMVKTSAEAANGDSGGPHYWINTDYNYIGIIGPHSLHTTNFYGSYVSSFAPAGYAIQDNLSWNFGAENPTC